MNFIINLLVYLAYIIIDAKQDSVSISRRGYVDHKWNWVLRATVAGLTAYNIYGISFIAVGWLLFLCPLSWWIFDIAINWFRGKPTFSYIGSGAIDNFFKESFVHADVVMLIIKAVTLVIGLSAWLLFL